jgi:aspartate aminotransferase
MEWPSFKPSRNLERLELPGVVHFGPEVHRPRSIGEDLLDLASEEPGFATPRSVLDSGVKALHQRKTSAVAGLGILDLRAAAARHLSLLSGGRPVNADNILVSCSEQQAMFNACFTLFDLGDEVLIPTPCKPSYPDLVRLARAKPVSVQGDVEWSLKVGVSELEVAANAQTKGLLLSSPVNPTGAVYTHSELQAILGWATERRLWVICDELYRRVHFGSAPAPSVLDLPDELLQQAIVVTGTGPAYGMTGFGVGLTLAPRPVTDWMCILQRHAAGSAAHPAQWAAATALADERVEPELDEIFRGLRARRDRVVQHFRTHLPGVEFVDPLGGFYFFFRVDGFFGSNVASSSDFCRHLLDESGVALVPGAAFGDDRWVRLSYSRPDAILEDALPRISYFATDLVNR